VGVTEPHAIMMHESLGGGNILTVVGSWYMPVDGASHDRDACNTDV
jgi:hypothetical protein